MTTKKLNTAQALLAHIGLKTEPLSLYGGKILVKQWTAKQRINFLSMISNNTAALDDEIGLVTPQGMIVAASMVDDKGLPLFAHEWKNNTLVFEDTAGIESLIQNRLQDTADAFIEVARFSGIMFSKTGGEDESDDSQEEQAAKN